jgi:ABC-type bacteriocin/lantibiotic exporter with double-glycine peptidase domain
MSRFRLQPDQKHSSPMPAVKLLWQLVSSEKLNIKAFFIFSVASGLLLLAIPFGIQILVQHFSLLYYFQSTLFLLICITLFLIGIGVMRALQLLLNERFQRRLFHDLTKEVEHSLFLMKDQKIDLRKKINHFFEIITLQKTSTYLIFDGLTLSLQTVLGLLVISIYHPLFFVYSLCIIAALYYVLRVLGRGVFELALKESKYKYDIIYYLQKMAFDSQFKEDPDLASPAKTEEMLNNYFWARENKFRVHFKQSLGLLLVQIIASGLLLAIGGVLVIKQKMTLGQFIAGELIITNVLISIFKFSNILDYWYDSLVSVYKIDQTLKELGDVKLNS